MNDSWPQEFARRIESFSEPFTGSGVPVSVKVRVVSGCFHREDSPHAYRLIDAALRERSDVWRALAGSLGVVLHEVLSRSPKRKNGHKRPGASDLWQAVYLALAEVFVTGDNRQLEAVSKVSAVLHYPRCVVQASAFFTGLETDGVRTDPRCPVCGCALSAAGAGPAEHTMHARLA